MEELVIMDFDKFSYKKVRPSGLETADGITSSTRLVLKEAERLGVDWQTIPGTKIIKLNFLGKSQYFYYQVPSTSKSVAQFCCDKNGTKKLLNLAQISTSKGFKIYQDDNVDTWMEIYDSLKKPLVIKPTHGSHGQDVFIGIKTVKQFKKIVSQILKPLEESCQGVIVEEMFKGTEYRILTTKNKVIGITERVPANVVGDGESTIEELIDIKNQDPRRGDEWSDGLALLKIKIDQKMKQMLKEQGKSLKFIPKKGKRVFLRKTSNLSQGGDSVDMTDIAHPSVKKLAIEAIKAIPDLNFAGIDFMSKDITKPQDQDSYIVIEINTSPGFDMHDSPYEGKNRNASREFLCLMYPELRAVNIIKKFSPNDLIFTIKNRFLDIFPNTWSAVQGR